MRLRRKKLSLKTMYKKKQPASTPVAPDKNQSTAETFKTFGSQAVKDNDTLKQSDTQGNSNAPDSQQTVIFESKPTYEQAVVAEDIVNQQAVENQDDVQFSMGDTSFDKTAKRLGGQKAYQEAFDKGDTVLSYRQWVQVRTPEFKAWFGDWENHPNEASKIINEEMGMVYHGVVDYL